MPRVVCLETIYENISKGCCELDPRKCLQIDDCKCLNDIVFSEQVRVLLYTTCDVVILMHKSNPQRDSWHKYGNVEQGKFLSNFPLVNNLWEQHIRKGKYIDS